MIQIRGAGQTDAEMIRTGTCKYCRSSHPPRGCPAYGMMCGKCGQVNHFSTVCRAPRWGLYRREEQSNGQTNQVKSNNFNHKYKYSKMHVEAKVSTISFYNSINIRYKLDTDQSKNYIPLHLYKRLFPKVNNTYIRPKTCKVKLRYNEKERICKFFIVQNGSTAVLGMWDIDKLGMLSINLKSKKQVAVTEKTIKTIVRVKGKQKVTSGST